MRNKNIDNFLKELSTLSNKYNVQISSEYTAFTLGDGKEKAVIVVHRLLHSIEYVRDIGLSKNQNVPITFKITQPVELK